MPRGATVLSDASGPARVSLSNGLTIVGRSPALLAALEIARRFAATPLPILIAGETGTGKELLARYIHSMSGRPGLLVDVDCGALPDDLIEGILFGHRRGAFTGATERAEGIIETAHGGTLFLDELASLPMRSQGKLLRALETQQIRPIGDTKKTTVDFRLVATVQQSVGDLVAEGRFRPDLMQRVAGAVIRVPSLAARPEDVIPLARHFAGLSGRRLTRKAEDALVRMDWPGNARELRWTVERAALLAAGPKISARSVAEAIEIGPQKLVAVEVGENGEPRDRRAELQAVCRAHSGDPARAAAALGVARSTLYRWLRKDGLTMSSFKAPTAVN